MLRVNKNKKKALPKGKPGNFEKELALIRLVVKARWLKKEETVPNRAGTIHT